jgi:hypothetical protein
MVSLDDFDNLSDCIYKNERYSVRDNGAVFRYPLEGKRARPTDNQWTFGKLNIKTGYLEIASVRVHRIVASAFHGEPPRKEHVVDHIDTNKQNNRPENLRWVTRLENILLNPITAKRIEIICGSVEAFLADPSHFRGKFPDQSFDWMCAVTKEEAQVSLERMLFWAKNDSPLNGGSLGEWIFNRETSQISSGKEPDYILSKTPNAAQRIITLSDKPNEFPSTPQAIDGDPLIVYVENLKEGSPFFKNHNGEYTVVKSGFSKDQNSLVVLTKSAYVWREGNDGQYSPVPIAELPEEGPFEDLPHALTVVTFENGLFVHEKIETGFHPTEELEEIFNELTQP